MNPIPSHRVFQQFLQQLGLSPFFLFLAAFSGATGIGPITSSSAGRGDPALIFRFLPSLSCSSSVAMLSDAQPRPGTHLFDKTYLHTPTSTKLGVFIS